MPSNERPEVDAEAVMELRRRTGLGVMECKLILAEASGDVDMAVQWLAERRPLPTFVAYSEWCPECGGGLRHPHQMECPHCHWLRVPPVRREAWGVLGTCPSCGFGYRWDGVRCSHCGHRTDA